MNPLVVELTVWATLLLLTLAACLWLLWPGVRQAAHRGRSLLMVVMLVSATLGIYAFVGSPHLLRQRREAELLRQDAHQRVADLKKKLETEPKNPELWEALGQASLETGQLPEAVAAFKQQTLLTSGRPDALLRLGKAQILAAHGEVTDEAAKTFTILEFLAPNAQGELFLAMHAAQRGQTPEARTRLHHLIDSPATPPEVRAAAHEQLEKLK